MIPRRQFMKVNRGWLKACSVIVGLDTWLRSLTLLRQVRG